MKTAAPIVTIPLQLTKGNTSTPLYLVGFEKALKKHKKELANFQKITAKKASGMSLVFAELMNQELSTSVGSSAAQLSQIMLQAHNSEQKAKAFRSFVATFKKNLQAYQSFLDGLIARMDTYQALAKQIGVKKTKAQSQKLSAKLTAMLLEAD